MYQKVVIVGRLGQDPEMRFTPSGQPVTNMSVATNRGYNDSNGNRIRETTWFRVTAWGRQAETVNQYLKKGSEVLIEGRMAGERVQRGEGDYVINPRVWTGSDGTPRASFELVAERVHFLGGRAEAGGPPYEAEPQDEEGIPF